MNQNPVTILFNNLKLNINIFGKIVKVKLYIYFNNIL